MATRSQNTYNYKYKKGDYLEVLDKNGEIRTIVVINSRRAYKYFITHVWVCDELRSLLNIERSVPSYNVDCDIYVRKNNNLKVLYGG